MGSRGEEKYIYILNVKLSLDLDVSRNLTAANVTGLTVNVYIYTWYFGVISTSVE